MSGILIELGLPTSDTIVPITLMFCLLIIARYHTVRSFSGSHGRSTFSLHVMNCDRATVKHALQNPCLLPLAFYQL